jgi:hypothetical protein
MSESALTPSQDVNNRFDFNSYLSYVVYSRHHYVDVDGINDLMNDLAENVTNKPYGYFREMFDSKLQAEIDRITKFIAIHLEQCAEDMAYVLQGWDDLSEVEKSNIYKEKTVRRTLRSIYQKMNKLKSFFKLNCFLITKVAKKFYVLLSDCEKNKGLQHALTDTFQTWKDSKSYNDFENVLCAYEPKIKDIQKKCVKFSGTMANETYPYLAAGHLKYGSRNEVDNVTNKVLLGVKLGFFIGVMCVIVCQATISRSNRFALWKSYGLFIFSVVGGIMVFNITWALNIRIWTNRKINYLSIFQIPHLEPNTMKVLQDSGTIMCVYATCLFWFFETGRHGGEVTHHTASVACPLILLAFVLVRFGNKVIKGRFNSTFGQGDSLTVFNGSVLYKCLIAPFAVVTFRDIYAADVLTSFNKVISDAIYGGCWVFTGAFLKDENDLIDDNDKVVCSPTNMANVSTVVISFVLWIRIAQCARRYHDTKAIPNIFNIIKYALSLAVAVVGRFIDALNFYYMTLAVVATLYKWYWDVVMDWGLCDSAHFSVQPYFLRPKRFFRQTWIYYVVIFVDLILRFLWIISLMPADLQDDLFGNYLSIQLGYLEILRRAMWGVFRVEWEHIAHENKSEFGFRSNTTKSSKGYLNSKDDKSQYLLLGSGVDEEIGEERQSVVFEYRKHLEEINGSDDDGEDEIAVNAFLVNED